MGLSPLKKILIVKNTNPTEVTVLTFLKCAVLWDCVHSHFCAAIIAIQPQNSINLAKQNSVPIKHPLPPCNPNPWQPEVSHESEIIQYLSFGD